MAPKFGTSGLRGLADNLTSDLVARYTGAFLNVCGSGTGLYVARDLRDSSRRISEAVILAARGAGVDVTDCGEVPTPALALAAMGAGAASIMVTGSHIPADRNGLKFYRPDGEISKADEAAILAALACPAAAVAKGAVAERHDVGAQWVARNLRAFGAEALAGLRVGIWSHSAVSRDLLIEAIASLGARVTEIGRSDIFIPVDTEAVPQSVLDMVSGAAQREGLDAVVSTDGDGDRPLLMDASGRQVAGDVLGQITARSVGAANVVTPVNSNSGVDSCGAFSRVLRTRIGSPYVIAGMAELGGKVVGYEANGGFLLGFDAQGPVGPLAALATRDSLLPIVAVLAEARRAGGVAALVAQEPGRFTAASRLQDVPPEVARAFLAGLEGRLDALLATFDRACVALDRTDGLRMTCDDGSILHLRSSGNAPEFRIYVEAGSDAEAASLLQRAQAVLSGRNSPVT